MKLQRYNVDGELYREGFVIDKSGEWCFSEDVAALEAEENSIVKYVHVTEEEMSGFLKAVEKLGGEVVDVKPVRTVEDTNSTKNEHRVKNVWATKGGVFDVKDVYTGEGKQHDS